MATVCGVVAVVLGSGLGGGDCRGRQGLGASGASGRTPLLCPEKLSQGTPVRAHLLGATAGAHL